MMHRHLQGATALFLDMNGTFMFGHDRFGQDQDYYPAYLAHGGNLLGQSELNAAVAELVAALDTLYRAHTHDTCFPSVSEIARDLFAPKFPAVEIAAIEQVVPAHEMGTVSPSCVAALQSLSTHFSLHVVSNLWSQSKQWRDYLARVVGEATFSSLTFSSDIGINKPDEAIFGAALAKADVEPGQVVMIGDDPERDLEPAKTLGMKSILVTGGEISASGADATVAGIEQLV